MNARKPNYRISISGKNVTEALTKYVLSLTYTDRVAGQSDEIELTLINSDGRFSDQWQPTTNDKIQISLGYDDSLIECGTFTIDTVESSGPPSTVSIKALAAGTNSPLRTRKTVAHEGKTIREIAQVTADNLNATIPTPDPANPTPSPQWTINDGTTFSHREFADWTTERATLSKAAGSIRAVLLMLNSPTAPLAFATAIGAAYDQYGPLLAAAQSITTKGRSEDGTEIRQTANLWAKAWANKYFPEAKKSIQIATAFADKLTAIAASLQDVDKTVTRSKLDIKTSWEAQTDEDDLAYLSRLARKYGILASVRGTVITFTSIYDVEASKPADTIRSGAFKSYRFSQTTIKQYAGAEVSWHDPDTGEAIVSRYAAAEPPSSATPGSYSVFESVNSFGTGDVLKVQERAETKAQADEIAKAAIHGRASREFEGEITIEGAPTLCAGCNVDLVESPGLFVLGKFAGRWAIVESRHSLVRGSGYVTTLKIKRGK
jgi:phage protein D